MYYTVDGNEPLAYIGSYNSANVMDNTSSADYSIFNPLYDVSDVPAALGFSYTNPSNYS